MLDISKIYTSNNDGKFRIINYKNAKAVSVEFIGTGYSTLTQSVHIREGRVKDRLVPSVCGVGFLGKGSNKPSKNGKTTKKYEVWSHMLKRCYCEKTQKKQPTYIGCAVDVSWHDFQVFSEWFDNNYIDGYHLDKDAKIKGNKIYSPEACVFISQTENNREAHSKLYRLKSPEGDVFDVINIVPFCEELSISAKGMRRMYRGERNHYKGWRKAPD